MSLKIIVGRVSGGVISDHAYIVSQMHDFASLLARRADLLVSFL